MKIKIKAYKNGRFVATCNNVIFQGGVNLQEGWHEDIKGNYVPNKYSGWVQVWHKDWTYNDVIGTKEEVIKFIIEWIKYKAQ